MSGSIQAELNRLARGGASYPSAMEWRGEAAAANSWCGTVGYSVVGALNVKALNTQPNWRALAGVANQLAGTTGLPACEALRRIAS